MRPLRHFRLPHRPLFSSNILPRTPSVNWRGVISSAGLDAERTCPPASRCLSCIASKVTHSPVLSAIKSAPQSNPAIIDSSGTLTYQNLLARSLEISKRLPTHDPIALFLNPDSSFVTSLLAAWLVSAPAVPLSPLYPAAALVPLVDDIVPSALITSSNLRYGVPPTAAPILMIDASVDESTGEIGPAVLEPPLPSAAFPGSTSKSKSERSSRIPSDHAIIFFTSGTTGKPKGVVWTHNMLGFQLQTLSLAWRWSSSDRVLNVLPLHHIHGLVNVVLSALYNNAVLEMHSAFDAHSVWSAFTRDDVTARPTVFMAVPAIYRKLIAYYNSASPADQRRMASAVSSMRLFVSGSAALPRLDSDAWFQISGHRILERYGMTEAGMILSNDYVNRYVGMLGTPLPGISVKMDREPIGELLVKGPNVFSEYWKQPEKTAAVFTEDGYFATGDIVERHPETGCFRHLGRANTDFINSGGYKVSSREIEEVICNVPGIEDCCVIGLEDDVLGEQIVAAIITNRTDEALFSDVRKKVDESLPRYKAPRRLFIVDSFPRNVLGKIQKQLLRSRLLFEGTMELRSSDDLSHNSN